MGDLWKRLRWLCVGYGLEVLVYIFSILCSLFQSVCYFSILKIIDFHGTIVIFEIFAVSTCDVIFLVFLWPLGFLLGASGASFWKRRHEEFIWKGNSRVAT
jgi:hypothetical protein